MQDESHPILAVTLDRIQWTVLTALLAIPPPNNPGLRALLAASSGDADARQNLPVKLSRATRVEGFSCGIEFLDAAVMRADRDEHARADGRDMHFFGITQQARLRAYYSQRRSVIQCSQQISSLPDHGSRAVPIMLLARLAVSLPFQGTGLGRSLLRDAIMRTTAISDIRLICVHALSPAVKRFYQHSGFRPLPAVVDPLGMYITMAEVSEIMRTACAEPA